MADGSDFLQLDPRGIAQGSRRQWLAEQLRVAIGSGTLPIGSRMPATRTLAVDLGFARGTVAEAYQRLTEEGLLITNRGGGTVVASSPAQPSAPVAPLPGRSRPTSEPTDTTIDLTTGAPDLASFPRTAWLRAERQVLQTAGAGQLGYAPPQGVRPLREELAGWLARSRGVLTTPERIVITGGVTGALSLLYQVLPPADRDRVALEDPGAEGNRRILDHWANAFLTAGVDDEGIVVDALARTEARVVVVTPAHQFPTGVSLSAARRRALINWAEDRDALIIEDDYDAEYRYDRAPVRALQPLAPEHVAYTASLSKTLAPALRLGWLVVPERLLVPVVEKRWAIDLGSPALPQLVLAELLRDGTIARHLRTMRTRHRARRDATAAAIEEHLTDRFPECRIRGIAAGVYLLLELPDGVDDQEFADRCRRAGVLVQPLSAHRVARGKPGVIINYANHPPERIRSAIATLAAALADST